MRCAWTGTGHTGREELVRHVLTAGLLAICLWLPWPVGTAQAAAPAGSEDALAHTYYGLLEQNTHFQESNWDPATGTYGQDKAYWFMGTLGNAILLKFGTYDPAVTGLSRADLLDHTVRSIAYAAAHNKVVNPNGDWGAVVYFDSGIEAYFAAAAQLMWPDLDAQTQANIKQIVHDEADYIVSAGANPTDPSREGGTTNGLGGGYQGDSKIEEMGNRTMILAAALAYQPNDPHAANWRRWLDVWMFNMNGLPVADLANPTVIDRQPISAWNKAQNLWDSFITEDHGSWNPIYQQSAGAYPGRDAAQFLIAGQPLPEALTKVPNDDELWDTMAQLGTDAGVPEDFMIDDRHHLYGRNLLPITYRSMVLGDRYAARAEQMLADHLGPYVAYPPAGRLTKFSGQPSYEPEARAELAMAYLLHYYRARLRGEVTSVSESQYFQHFSYARNYGTIPGFVAPGLVAQQTPQALAAAVTKPSFVKFAFLPQHDDWLFNVAGTSPSLLPSTAPVGDPSVRVYRRARDGYEATATMVARGSSYAGFTTLPGGEVVYATTGTGSGEGRLNLYNLDMPGVPGLDGNRTFTAADGSVTISSADTATRSFQGDWLNVDGRAGFVIHGSSNPITVSATSATLSNGPAAGAAGMVVQGFSAQSPRTTAADAAKPQPSGGPAALHAALTDGYLSLFNLGGTALTAADLTVPQSGATTLYEGEQETTADGDTTYRVTLDGGAAAVQAPRFSVTSRIDGRGSPAGLDIDVVDSHHVRVENTHDPQVAQLTVTSLATGEQAEVTVPPGETAEATFNQGALTPVADLARSQITYPSSPLPPGMSSPNLAVDGNPSTAWQPGAGGRRMIVNLGARHALTSAAVQWSGGDIEPYEVDVSDDGVSWTRVGGGRPGAPTEQFALSQPAQYVSVLVSRWGPGDAGLAELSVQGSETVVPAVTNGDGGIDRLDFVPTQARYVRMLGARPATGFGYSLYELEVYAPGGGANLALGGTATASSFLTGFEPQLAVDGDLTTRWAVSVADRSRTDSWLAVDLGAERTISEVQLLWQAAYGAAYDIQVSDDDQSWRTVASVP